MKNIILASQSPRRKQLLQQIGLSFDVMESNYEEDMTLALEPIELAKFLALEKAKEVAKRCENAIIISADTFIVFEDKIIGKPKDELAARNILQAYSSKSCQVATGYSLVDTESNKIINDCSIAQIFFRPLSAEEIDAYISTGEPLDKAGAFGIQEKGAVLIDRIEGDYFTIVGLPITKIYLGLKEMGINPLSIG